MEELGFEFPRRKKETADVGLHTETKGDFLPRARYQRVPPGNRVVCFKPWATSNREPQCQRFWRRMTIRQESTHEPRSEQKTSSGKNLKLGQFPVSCNRKQEPEGRLQKSTLAP